MSATCEIFVGPEATTNDVAALLSSVLQRPFVADGSSWRSESAQPWVGVHENELTEEFDDGDGVHTYDVVIQVEADGFQTVARQIFDALKAHGRRAYLVDPEAGVREQFEPAPAAAE